VDGHAWHVALVLGGARSGKSVLAESMAEERAGGAEVTYLATGWVPDGSDPGWAARVAAHRLRRPTGWTTVEVAEDLPGALRAATGVVLVDSLGTWVGGAPRFAVDAGELTDALRDRGAPTVLVSDEVGLGVHPETSAGVAFRDALGDLNRSVAAVADEVVLVVAGRALRLA
jgi:adenosylcobinamide kinase/adenosylcobinamide-phosphate guanylyltransferase